MLVQSLVPDLRAGHTLLVTAHSNSLRALVAHLDRLTAQEVPGVEIPTGSPLRYDLDADLRPIVRGGRHLAPGAQETTPARLAGPGDRPR